MLSSYLDLGQNRTYLNKMQLLINKVYFSNLLLGWLQGLDKFQEKNKGITDILLQTVYIKFIKETDCDLVMSDKNGLSIITSELYKQHFTSGVTSQTAQTEKAPQVI